MELLLPGSCLSALLLPFLPDLGHGPPIWSPWLFFLPLPHSNKPANHYNWHHADQLLQCRRSSSSLLDTCNLLPPYNFVKVTQEWETTKNSPHLRCESKWRAPCCLNLWGIVQNIPFHSSLQESSHNNAASSKIRGGFWPLFLPPLMHWSGGFQNGFIQLQCLRYVWPFLWCRTYFIWFTRICIYRVMF